MGEWAEQVCPLSNPGQLPLVVTGMESTGTDAARFRVPPHALTLPAGADLDTLRIRFQPAAAGRCAATPQVIPNTPTTPTRVALEAMGADPRLAFGYRVPRDWSMASLPACRPWLP